MLLFFSFFFLILLLLLLFEHYYLLLLDFLITPNSINAIFVDDRVSCSSRLKRKKLCVATASRKSFRLRLSSILFFFFVSFFFSLFFFLSLAETDDQSSLITESFDMVVQLEVLFGGEWRGEIVRTCY